MVFFYLIGIIFSFMGIIFSSLVAATLSKLNFLFFLENYLTLCYENILENYLIFNIL